MSCRPPGLKIGFFLGCFLIFRQYFLFFFCTSPGFGNKIVPKPEEVPKKIKTFLLKPEERYQKNPKQKKKKKEIYFHVVEAPKPEDRKIGVFSLVFLVPPQVLAFFCFFGTSPGFCNKIVPKPEEVPQKSKLFC